MRRAIRGHLRDVAAALFLMVLALITTGIILVRQSANLPSWLPVLGTDTFELEAQLGNAQAVTPGQGQTVTMAGAKVGTISGVALDGGDAVVTMRVDQQYAQLIHPDASVLLRPRTSLQDMTLEIDPGTGSRAVAEGSTIPAAQTQPNVQPDQILASLDGDTRSYLQLLLQAAGQGLHGNGTTLAAGLKRLEPTARDLASIGRVLAERRRNLTRAITNLGMLSQELGHRDTQLAGFVRSSNDVLASFARQEASVRAALQELPGALRQTRSALRAGDHMSAQLGPASRRLIPAAQALGPALRETRPLLLRTVGPIEHQIRPFARAVQAPLRHTEQASGPLGETSTKLTGALDNLNLGLNALAYNPHGSAQEGYLFWLGWMNHDANALFSTQDAGGPLRHGLVLLSCSTAFSAEGVATADPVVKTLEQLGNIPTSSEITANGGC
jgi:phospholipid/cholesterol/gamma-HCH transport system substrate-binding protein